VCCRLRKHRCSVGAALGKVVDLGWEIKLDFGGRSGGGRRGGEGVDGQGEEEGEDEDEEAHCGR